MLYLQTGSYKLVLEGIKRVAGQRWTAVPCHTSEICSSWVHLPSFLIMWALEIHNLTKSEHIFMALRKLHLKNEGQYFPISLRCWIFSLKSLNIIQQRQRNIFPLYSKNQLRGCLKSGLFLCWFIFSFQHVKEKKNWSFPIWSDKCIEKQTDLFYVLILFYFPNTTLGQRLHTKGL